VKITAMSKKR